MNRLTRLRPEFVQFIPEKLDEGVLYISRRYKTASHLCCCGCGLEVVTPLNPAKWSLSESPSGEVSLSSSIGNWSFPCISHYWIDRNEIRWAGAMSAAQIVAVKAGDRRDAELHARRPVGRFAKFRQRVSQAWSASLSTFRRWWGS
jgi:Family of unknown function (DUF6527)